MEMKPSQFFKLVRSIENSQWLNDAVSTGQVRLSHHPISNAFNPQYLGRFTKTGFTFSCPEFAVQFHIEKDTELSTKQWYLLNHITSRNRITSRLMAIIGNAQSSFIQTGNPAALLHLPYQSILDEYVRSYPDYLDPSIISRIVRRKHVQLPGGDIIPLSDLFPKRSFLFGIKIKEMIQQETVFLTDRIIRRRLLDEGVVNISIRYVTYCRNRMGIPPARIRRNNNPNSQSVWGKLPRLIWRLYPQFRRMQEYMKLAQASVKSITRKGNPGLCIMARQRISVSVS